MWNQESSKIIVYPSAKKTSSMKSCDETSYRSMTRKNANSTKCQ